MERFELATFVGEAKCVLDGNGTSMDSTNALELDRGFDRSNVVESQLTNTIVHE